MTSNGRFHWTTSATAVVPQTNGTRIGRLKRSEVIARHALGLPVEVIAREAQVAPSVLRAYLMQDQETRATLEVQRTTSVSANDLDALTIAAERKATGDPVPTPVHAPIVGVPPEIPAAAGTVAPAIPSAQDTPASAAPVPGSEVDKLLRHVDLVAQQLHITPEQVRKVITLLQSEHRIPVIADMLQLPPMVVQAIALQIAWTPPRIQAPEDKQNPAKARKRIRNAKRHHRKPDSDIVTGPRTCVPPQADQVMHRLDLAALAAKVHLLPDVITAIVRDLCAGTSRLKTSQIQQVPYHQVLKLAKCIRWKPSWSTKAHMEERAQLEQAQRDEEQNRMKVRLTRANELWKQGLGLSYIAMIYGMPEHRMACIVHNARTDWGEEWFPLRKPPLAAHDLTANRDSFPGAGGEVTRRP